MDIQSIRNYIAVSDRIASSGQPNRDEFQLIANEGFECVINLSMPDSDYAIGDEGFLVSSLGMNYFHIPVPFEMPTVDQLALFIKLLESLSHKKCWVHCALNYRASAFLYQFFRLSNRMSDSDARQVIFPGWQPDATWVKFMQLTTQDIPGLNNS